FTTRRPSAGRGMGLAIAREIVESLGGKIELESTPGVGTRALVRLPRTDPERAAREARGGGAC
ncbi:MAG: ATP-binding protein, partial [Vicinamibacteria bacterium]